MRRPFLTNPLTLCVLAVALVACQAAVGTYPPQSTAPSTVQAPQATAALTPSLPPSPTSDSARVLLVRPEGSDSLTGKTESAARELAASSGLNLVAQSSLTAADLTPSTKVVLVFPPDPGLDGLSQGAPDVQFVALGIPGLKPAANVTVIGGEENAAQAAFLAGFIAAQVTPDWRVGVVASSQDSAVRDGFLNGARYLCGICNPKTPPYPGYPVAVEAAAGDFQTAADALKQKGVETVFVAPSLADPAMLNGLAGKGFRMIGLSSPAESYKPKWVVTVQADPAQALKAIWSDVAAGKSGQQVAMPLTLADSSPQLTPGRARLAGQVQADLAAGFINPQAVDNGQ